MGYTELLLFASKWQQTVKNDLGDKQYVPELLESEFDFINNQNIEMFPIWLPFYNMAIIDNDK